jgi:hypothetical protein
MLDITQTNGAKAIINTAANSQVGNKIIINLQDK